MQRLTSNSVKITEAEMKASDRFNRLLDEGRGLADAVDIIKVQHPGLDSDFYDWLGNVETPCPECGGTWRYGYDGRVINTHRHFYGCKLGGI